MVDLSRVTAVTADTATQRCSVRDRRPATAGQPRDTGRGWTGSGMREIQVEEEKLDYFYLNNTF